MSDLERFARSHLSEGQVMDIRSDLAARGQRIAELEAALRTARDDALEEAAQIIDQCNKDGPYNAIGAASVIRSLKSDAAIWPRGCKDTESCGDRHRACMYFGCRHRGKDICAAIDAEIERLDRAALRDAARGAGG